MRKIFSVLLAAAAIGVATPAAAEWVKLTTDDRGLVQYYDPASVKRDGQLVRYLTRADGRDAQLDEDEPVLSDSVEEIDCKGKRMRPIEITDYDENGRQIDYFDMSAEAYWFDIMPDSIAARKHTQFCR